MFCKTLNGTMSVKCCLLRQEIARELADTKYGCGTFEKCFACNVGIEIKNNAHSSMDLDVKILIESKMPKEKKPKRLKLKTWPKKKIRML